MADHAWEERTTRRGAAMQRQCANCGLWETELTRAKPCRPPKTRITIR